MGIHVIKMPDLGEGITEVEIVAWRVAVGDTVELDQTLADVMTDKATVEIPSPVAGQVASLGGEAGQVLAVGAPLIGIALEEGVPAAAPVPQTLAADGAGRSSPAPLAATQEPTPPMPAAAPSPVTGAGPISPARVAPLPPTPGAAVEQASMATVLPSTLPSTLPAADMAARPIASPALRRRAWELGVDLLQVRASGTGGRIMQADLDAHVHRHGAARPADAASIPAVAMATPATVTRPDLLASAPPAPAGTDAVQTIKVIGLRRRIAQKMQEAKRRIPHFAYVEECDVTELEALRMQLNQQFGASRGKLTLLPFLLRAMVLAIRSFPQVNALFDDETGVITRHSAVHAGIATQTEAGLMVPVLRHAQVGDLWTHATAIARLAEAARSGRATRDELSGSTITLTSLGALGGIASTPIINAPEVAIVGVNRIVERPMPVEGGIAVRKLMNLSSSFDHRVVDGHDAARFIQAVRGLLEAPATLLVADPPASK